MVKEEVLVGGTDAHGVGMTAISLRNLRREGVEATVICQWPETGKPDLFWTKTITELDFTTAKKLIVVDVPLPMQTPQVPNAPEEALKNIDTLIKKGIKVVIIDHHKTSETIYGQAIRLGAEVILCSTAEVTHYGSHDEFARRWGRIAAIADRDPSVLPCTEHEERMALGLDVRVREYGKEIVSQIIPRIINNDEEWFLEAAEIPPPPVNPEVHGKIVILRETTPGWTFKQLDAACKLTNSVYALGVDYSRGTAIVGITYWKSRALPVALALKMEKFIGHGSAVVIPLSQEKDTKLANEKLGELIAKLNEVAMEGMK